VAYLKARRNGGNENCYCNFECKQRGVHARVCGPLLWGNSVSGVNCRGGSELWCWEVVKLLSYTRRERVSGLSCCVLLLLMLLLLLSVHLLALPWPLHDNTTPEHDNPYSVQNVVPNTVLRT